MPVTVTNADGVTVVMLTSDPNSACSPVCQILMGLCYCPVSCSFVSPLKRRVQVPSESVLGAFVIMAGILIIGLGSIFHNLPSGVDSTLQTTYYSDMPFVICVGAVFLFCGIMRIICEKFPHPYLVIINMVLILAEFCFAIAAFVYYSFTLSLQRMPGWDMCDHMIGNDYKFKDSWYDTHSRLRSTESPETNMIKICLEAKELLEILFRTMGVMLIMLFVLVLAVVIATVILRIDAICNKEKGENEDAEDSEVNKALLEDVPIHPKV